MRPMNTHLIDQATGQPAAQLIDPFGREISYLRVSVTDRCDFRCVYCMAEDMTFLPKKDILSLEELDRLCSAFVARGVRKLRLTGGEPLVRRNIMGLVESLSRHLASGALEELTLTTNGSQLARFAGDLFRHGVRRVNVSLDTRDPDKFRAITRWGDLDKVLGGIAAAQAAGLAVKLNMVALKDVNEHEIADMLEWCHGQGIDLTLIETMPLGDIDGDRTDQYLPLSLVRARLETLYAGRHPLQDRRPGALHAGQGDRRAARADHAAHPQFLRKLQPGAPHLHRHALHVPRPGGRRRPARALAGVRKRRGPAGGHRRGDLAQAQGPRLRHRPAQRKARRLPPHERDGGVGLLPFSRSREKVAQRAG
jgi:molybdenum cofactor biosynthesis enzyme MoaA